MATVHHLVGIDPGLVHTGCVLIDIDRPQRIVAVHHEAVAGPDVTRIQQWLGGYRHTADIWIEAYRPRSNFGTDERMVKAVNDIKSGLPKATVLNNTGVKKVVRQPLMEVLGCWKFSTPTHHQDLRSAARIALLGALRDDHLNTVIADIVRDHINSNPWRIVTS